MADQQKKKRTSKARKPNNKAYLAREKHPSRVLRRIIQSSGFAEAERYADKFGFDRVLRSIQIRSFHGEDGKTRTALVRWIEKKRAEAQRKADGHAPIGYHRGRALRRWQESCAAKAGQSNMPPAP